MDRISQTQVSIQPITHRTRLMYVDIYLILKWNNDLYMTEPNHKSLQCKQEDKPHQATRQRIK